MILAPPDVEPNVQGQLNEGFKPGTYGGKITIDTTPTSQGEYPKGPSQFEMLICEGQCGSKHPHSEIYGKKTVKFSVG